MIVRKRRTWNLNKKSWVDDDGGTKIARFEEDADALQYAINQATEGETIHVKAGNYIMRKTMFIGKNNVRIVGENPDKTHFKSG